MKRVFVFLLCVLLAGLCACGTTEHRNDDHSRKHKWRVFGLRIQQAYEIVVVLTTGVHGIKTFIRPPRKL